jgi:hypothetical protein
VFRLLYTGSYDEAGIQDGGVLMDVGILLLRIFLQLSWYVSSNRRPGEAELMLCDRSLGVRECIRKMSISVLEEMED